MAVPKRSRLAKGGQRLDLDAVAVRRTDEPGIDAEPLGDARPDGDLGPTCGEGLEIGVDLGLALQDHGQRDARRFLRPVGQIANAPEAGGRYLKELARALIDHERQAERPGEEELGAREV